MPHLVDKQLLLRQFQRAAVQRQAAERLLYLLGQHSGGPFLRALEIGCGTGLLTRRLLARFSSVQELCLNDLVPDFASRLVIALPCAFCPAILKFCLCPAALI